ncbi:MAG TPA: patatin-like phospholipase family protein [Solirubrobacterales bacterium]|nr:patatin-like phospholipase family protein [Solirubrobacterales bacterium]
MAVRGDPTPPDRFRVLSIDGGGIRGLIAARVIARLEELISEEAGEARRLADCFHMFAGTSTGGLLALGLTVPDPAHPTRPRLSGADLVELYLSEGPRIFGDTLHKLLSLGGWIAPKHSEARLERALRDRFGDARLRDALRELIVTSYEMSEPGPHFFKRWRARESDDRDVAMVDVGLATSAAPTYFPSHGLDGRAFVDGGLFAANPSVAAVVEALKRRDEDPHDLDAGDLLLVSLGTGQHETGHPQSKVRRWGRIGWILPRRQDPALIAAFLDGQSDAADHWVEILLNREPGRAALDPASRGAGPRYFRFQTKLQASTPLDDASPDALRQLNEAADRLLTKQDGRLREVARRLASGSPLPG